MEEEKSWNEVFDQWCVDHPEELKKLGEKFSPKSLRDYRNGNVKSLDHINPLKRRSLYDHTQLQIFHVDIPTGIDVNACLEGKSPRSHLGYWLMQQHISKNEFSERCGIARNSLDRFLAGETLKRGTDETIIDQFRKYAGLKEEKTEEERPSTYRETNERTKALEKVLATLDNMSDGVLGLRAQVARELPADIAIEILQRGYNPSLERRIEAVNLALDCLKEEMDYFRSASQEERDQLARSVDVHIFGYVVGILGSINKPDSYDTILRVFNPPTARTNRRQQKK